MSALTASLSRFTRIRKRRSSTGEASIPRNGNRLPPGAGTTNAAACKHGSSSPAVQQLSACSPGCYWRCSSGIGINEATCGRSCCRLLLALWRRSSAGLIRTTTRFTAGCSASPLRTHCSQNSSWRSARASVGRSRAVSFACLSRHAQGSISPSSGEPTENRCRRFQESRCRDDISEYKHRPRLRPLESHRGRVLDNDRRRFPHRRAKLNKGIVRKDALIAACVFAIFGCSDMVEATTGAWWRPWWLLVWKGLCILALLILTIRYYQRRGRGQSS